MAHTTINTDLLAALKSAAASIEQLVKLRRIPAANNQGLRDAKAAIAQAEAAPATPGDWGMLNLLVDIEGEADNVEPDEDGDVRITLGAGWLETLRATVKFASDAAREQTQSDVEAASMLSDQDIAQQALDLAVAHIQRVLGQTDGYYAGLHFSGDLTLNLLSNYVAAERDLARLQAEEGGCLNPAGHSWVEGPPDRGDEGPIRCEYCGADGDA